MWHLTPTVWIGFGRLSILCSNVGSVVECSPATRAARVRFPDVATFCYQKTDLSKKTIRDWWWWMNDIENVYLKWVGGTHIKYTFSISLIIASMFGLSWFLPLKYFRISFWKNSRYPRLSSKIFDDIYGIFFFMCIICDYLKNSLN